MRQATRGAFLVFVVAAVLFLTQPVGASYPCEQFGDLTIGGMSEECYPGDPFFCTDGDNYCWQISPAYGCETAWYGICWDIDNPCEYYCCCRRI